jgi:hypothetical protein
MIECLRVIFMGDGVNVGLDALFDITGRAGKKYGRKQGKLMKRKLTNVTELSSSSEVASCAATQELPSILRNPKVHYRVHKSPPPVPILSQISTIHTIKLYLSKIRFNIIHPPTSRSS